MTGSEDAEDVRQREVDAGANKDRSRYASRPQFELRKLLESLPERLRTESYQQGKDHDRQARTHTVQ